MSAIASSDGSMLVERSVGVRARSWITRPAIACLALFGLYAAQLVVGVLNVSLLAPVAVQLLHLLLADSIWIALVLSAAHALGDPAAVGS